MKQRIHQVYIGNVPSHRWENTYRHNCGELLIERYGFDVLRYGVTEGRGAQSAMPRAQSQVSTLDRSALQKKNNPFALATGAPA